MFDLLLSVNFFSPAAGGSSVLFWEAHVQINWAATYSFVVLVVAVVGTLCAAVTPGVDTMAER